MVDTIKLLINIIDPLKLGRHKFEPITLKQLTNSSPGSRTYLNLSAAYAKNGVYMPNLTMFKRFRKGMPTYQLAVEFSAPNVLYNNNFDELEESDFEGLIAGLQSKLYELIGVKFFKQQLINANVSEWHPSKNVVFLDYTSCQTILNTISKLDVSRTYDLQKTDFRDGHVVHKHCNSLDIAFYDKLADLKKVKTSPKRAEEKNSLMQLNLLDELKKYQPLEILRYEVRFVGRASIKRAFPNLESWTLETLFKKQLCQDVLIKHWRKLTSSVDMLALDINKPYELLQNYLIDNPGATPQAAMAAVTGLLINGQEGVVGLRNLLDARYGQQAWSRVKKLLKSPQANRFTHFQHIDETLERFEPTHMTKFIKSHIENNGNL